MHVPSLIEKKRDGHTLTTKEIKSLVEDFVVGEIPDYQMSALAKVVTTRNARGQERSVVDTLGRESIMFENLRRGSSQEPSELTRPAQQPCSTQSTHLTESAKGPLRFLMLFTSQPPAETSVL